MQKYSIFNLIKNAFSNHQKWDLAWKDPTPKKEYDVVIIGGGIIGSAIAYFLKACPHFQGDVVVIERDPSYAKASTPRSLGGVRQQFSIRENIEIGLFGVDFVKRAFQYLSVDNEPVDLGWRELGYLFLASSEGQRILAENQQLQSQCGAKIEILNPDNLKIKFPWLNTDLSLIHI